MSLYMLLFEFQMILFHDMINNYELQYYTKNSMDTDPPLSSECRGSEVTYNEFLSAPYLLNTGSNFERF